MSTKLVLLMSLFLLASALEVAFNFQEVKAAGTIYIRANGSIDPRTAPILSSDNITYTIAGNINSSIVIEKSNIVINGAGHEIIGVGSNFGFSLSVVSNVTIRNTTISGFYHGVYLLTTSRCTITGNNITANNYDGIRLFSSSENNISGNYIANNGNDGVKLFANSSHNIISQNIVTRNGDDGIQTSGDNNVVSACNITQNAGLGINAINGSKIVINSNNMIANLWGMEMLSCQSVGVARNNIQLNSLYGVYLEYSMDVSIDSNNITSNHHGVKNYYCSGIHVRKNKITTNTGYGVWLDYSSNETIEDNIITENNDAGIYVRYGRGNTIQRNNIAANYDGISFSGASNNIICENNITNNSNGVGFTYNSKDVAVYDNNFVNNTQHGSSTTANVWNDNAEGNYWSDYSGVDLNRDGIGDILRAIDANNQDKFPLMGMFHSFNTSKKVWVNVISNSSTANFQVFESLPNVTITMHVSNMTSAQTYGFCRVRIPHALMKGPFSVTVNGSTPLFANYTLRDNATYRWIYFSYQHSTLEVVIQGLETIPPTIHITSPEGKIYPVKDVPLTFTVDEPTSWIGYSLDGQANTTITGNTTMTGLSDGTHRMTVFANDTVGNMGLSNTVHFTVDTTPPTILIVTPENRTYGSNQVSLVFTVNEPVSWMGYSLDGNPNVTISGNTTVGGLTDAFHTINVCANDTVGNMGSSSTMHFTVFTPAPSVYILSPQNKTYAITNIPLTFTVDEPVIYISYSQDSQANVTITANTTLIDLSEGHHRIVVYANDTDGNMGLSDTVHFTIDLTPPDIGSLSQLPPADNVLPTDIVKVNATVTDSLSGVKKVVLNYTTNNGTWFVTNMTKLQGNIWSATMHAFPFGTNVTYVIKAEDNVNHTVTTEDLGYTYRYTVVPEFPAFLAVPLFMITTLLSAMAVKRKRKLQFRNLKLSEC